jgi:hypothetical protein
MKLTLNEALEIIHFVYRIRQFSACLEDTISSRGYLKDMGLMGFRGLSQLNLGSPSGGD